MGTNYYHRYDECDCCGRYEERHICKSMVSFQGYFTEGEWDQERSAFLPDTPVIVSWSDWKVALRNGGHIVDEYQRSWGTEEFIAEVEATNPESRRRQYAWMNSNRPSEVGFGKGAWLDEDKFSFSVGEFS